MQKYECAVCGYVYDPEVGDPDSGKYSQGRPLQIFLRIGVVRFVVLKKVSLR